MYIVHFHGHLTSTLEPFFNFRKLQEIPGNFRAHCKKFIFELWIHWPKMQSDECKNCFSTRIVCSCQVYSQLFQVDSCYKLLKSLHQICFPHICQWKTVINTLWWKAVRHWSSPLCQPDEGVVLFQVSRTSQLLRMRTSFTCCRIPSELAVPYRILKVLGKTVGLCNQHPWQTDQKVTAVWRRSSVWCIMLCICSTQTDSH